MLQRTFLIVALATGFALLYFFFASSPSSADLPKSEYDATFEAEPVKKNDVKSTMVWT